MISVETAPAETADEMVIVHESQVVEMVQGDGTIPLADKIEEAAETAAAETASEEPATVAVISDQEANAVLVAEPVQPSGETEARQKTDENTEKPKFRSETEAEFRARLMAAYEAHAEAALDRKDHEDALKSAKANEKAALARVESIIQKGRLSFPLFDRTAAEERDQQDSQTVTCFGVGYDPSHEGVSTEPTTMAVASPGGFNLDDEKTWALIKIDELANHGLSEKNLERLKENGITNVLEAEKLRCEVGSGALKRPKGMGEKKWTEFEESCLNWLQAKRNEVVATIAMDTCEAFTAASERVQAELNAQDEQAAIAKWTGTVEAEQSKPVQTESAQKDEREIALWRRSQQVVGMSVALTAERQQGYDDYKAEKPITACPFEPGVKQDHWLFGWHDAADDSGPEKPNAEPVTVASSNSEVDPLADL